MTGSNLPCINLLSNHNLYPQTSKHHHCWIKPRHSTCSRNNTSATIAHFLSWKVFYFLFCGSRCLLRRNNGTKVMARPFPPQSFQGGTPHRRTARDDDSIGNPTGVRSGGVVVPFQPLPPNSDCLGIVHRVDVKFRVNGFVGQLSQVHKDHGIASFLANIVLFGSCFCGRLHGGGACWRQFADPFVVIVVRCCGSMALAVSSLYTLIDRKFRKIVLGPLVRIIAIIVFVDTHGLWRRSRLYTQRGFLLAWWLSQTKTLNYFHVEPVSLSCKE